MGENGNTAWAVEQFLLAASLSAVLRQIEWEHEFQALQPAQQEAWNTEQEACGSAVKTGTSAHGPHGYRIPYMDLL